MSRLSEIYEGWKNVIFPTPEIEALAKQRALICVECDSLVLGVCTRCCCPHVGKTHSPDSRCPENKWTDGWGNVPNINQPESVTTLPEIPILYWDETMQDWTHTNPDLPISIINNLPADYRINT